MSGENEEKVPEISSTRRLYQPRWAAVLKLCFIPLALYTVSQKKLCQFYFLNKSVKHWPMLIIFGMQHHEETLRK